MQIRRENWNKDCVCGLKFFFKEQLMKLAKKISKGIALCAALTILGAMGGGNNILF